MSRKILIVTADAGEGYEAWYAVHRFQEAGIKPVVAAPSRKRLHLVMHDFEPGWDTYVERPGYGMNADVAIRDIRNSKGYDAVLLIGGRAPEFLRHDPRLIALIQDFANKGKWLFAICHGIQILVAAGVVKGRCVTCYEHVRSEVEMAGGTWSRNQAERDGKMVTAQTWESHPDFYRHVFSCLAESA
ncbi:MAG: DJ-1/PfpI family protein [Bryobacteraceae bacterium]|nr:DJ-1/PfpI family protein [Bryobacteraceae bacterium]